MKWSEYSPDKFRWLQDRGSNLYSQNGEDGVLQAIFERIGATNKWCFECGAADGLWFSNTRRFIEREGWNAVLVENDHSSYKKLFERYIGWDNGYGHGFVWTVHETVTAEGEPDDLNHGHGRSIDNILSAHKAPTDLDLLVIDVDGSDYYLFNSLNKYQPRVVVCEYSPDADEMFIPELNGPGQAGRRAILYVGDARGYMPVCQTRYNIIFVRKDLIDLLVEDAKPASPTIKVGAVMSTPRIGFLATSDLVYQACMALGWQFSRGEGVWWHHSLTRCIESQIEHGMEYIVTIDYDSIFTIKNGADLILHLYDNPQIDIVTSIQLKREGGEPLVTTDGEVTLNNPLIPITQAHFGLTAFRASVFEKIPKPWFLETANENGQWGEGRIDPDIHFWNQCRKAGIKMMAATDVVIGHIEQVVTWPKQDFTASYQTMNEWRKNGKPEWAFQKPPALTPATMEMKD